MGLVAILGFTLHNGVLYQDVSRGKGRAIAYLPLEKSNSFFSCERIGFVKKNPLSSSAVYHALREGKRKKKKQQEI